MRCAGEERAAGALVAFYEEKVLVCRSGERSPLQLPIKRRRHPQHGRDEAVGSQEVNGRLTYYRYTVCRPGPGWSLRTTALLLPAALWTISSHILSGP